MTVKLIRWMQYITPLQKRMYLKKKTNKLFLP